MKVPATIIRELDASTEHEARKAFHIRRLFWSGPLVNIKSFPKDMLRRWIAIDGYRDKRTMR